MFRYLRCANRRYGCAVSVQMEMRIGSRIVISNDHIHNHIPTPLYSIELRTFLNRLRERSTTENVIPQMIVDQESHS